MNIDVLIFAAPFIAATALLLIYQRALRIAAMLGGIAILGILATFNTFRAMLVHFSSSGIGMAVVVALLVAGVLATFLDLRGHHKKALMGRKGEGHHLRPFLVVGVFAVAAVLFVAILPRYTTAAGQGGGTVIHTLFHPGA